MGKRTTLRKTEKRRWLRVKAVTVVFFALFVSCVLWSKWAEEQAHIAPDYPKEDIEWAVQNQEALNQEALNQETLNRETLNQETLNQETLNREVLKKQVSKKEVPREEILREKMLSEAEYDLLFRQTGLGRTAVDFLFAEGRQGELLRLQEAFFGEVEVECSPSTVFTRAERLVKGGTKIPYVEQGDILISFGSHALGWRNGHAAIVTDASKRLTVEARLLGTDSMELPLSTWEKCPNFAVLRLKDVTKEKRAEVAVYAREKLVDIPYALHAGIGERMLEMLSVGASRVEAKSSESAGGKTTDEETGAADAEVASLAGTQCAHLVWYAYRRFGYDLDSDGGVLVTPRDLYESPLLEVVQIYGLPMEDS